MGLRGDERVLDYGSGSGAAARHIAKRLRAGGGRLTCVDISPSWQRALRRTLRRYQNAEYALGDVRDLGLPEGSFDVVLVHWMLHDVPVADRPSVLAVLARLLRPGGRLFIREPAGPSEGAAAALRSLLSGAGLSELRGAESSAFFLGRNYSGVWERPEDWIQAARPGHPAAGVRRPFRRHEEARLARRRHAHLRSAGGISHGRAGDGVE